MDKLSVLYVILAGMSWGSAGIFSRFLQNCGFSAFQMALGRNCFAAVFMLLFVLLYNPKLLKIKPKKLLLFALSGFGLLGTAAFYYWAMELTSFSTAVVLMYTAPVIVMIVSVLFLGEKFTIPKLVGIVGALIGCGLVTGIIGNLRFSIMGIIVGLLSGISYSIYNICVKIEMQRGDDPICATTYCFIFAFLASLVVGSPIQSLHMVAAAPLPTSLLIAGMGFFIGAFPYLIYTFAMRKIPAGVASSMACIEPMTATIISVLFLGEELSGFAILGIVFILGSVILLSREEENQK